MWGLPLQLGVLAEIHKLNGLNLIIVQMKLMETAGKVWQ